MSQSRERKPPKKGGGDPGSSDPLQESLDELARIADVLVDRLALDCNVEDEAAGERATAAAVAESPAASRDEIKDRLEELERLVETTGQSQSDVAIDSYLDKVLMIGGESATEEPIPEESIEEAPVAGPEAVAAAPRLVPLVEPGYVRVVGPA